MCVCFFFLSFPSVSSLRLDRTIYNNTRVKRRINPPDPRTYQQRLFSASCVRIESNEAPKKTETINSVQLTPPSRSIYTPPTNKPHLSVRHTPATRNPPALAHPRHPPPPPQSPATARCPWRAAASSARGSGRARPCFFVDFLVLMGGGIGGFMWVCFKSVYINA